MQRPKAQELVATVLALGVLAAVWGAMVWRPTDTVRWLLAGGAVVGAAVLALWGLLGPIARWLSGERTELTAEERRSLTAAERVEAVNQTRSALMQSVTGLVVIVGVAFTAAGLIYTARTLDITRQGQVTDRYTKAIEQLGSSRPEVRMGGIYALERLMADSSRDRRTINAVLAAYIRSHAQDKPPAGADETRLAVDVEAALIVLGRAPRTPATTTDLGNADFHGKNLSGVKLAGANLTRANLTRASLFGANLSEADLSRARISGANVSGANLSGTDVPGADLTGADLTGADLSGATLFAANLTNAVLSRANLVRTNLFSAYLRGADLSGTDMRNANLRHADLRGADLSNADLRYADLRAADLRNLQGGPSPEQLRKLTKTDSSTRFQSG